MNWQALLGCRATETVVDVQMMDCGSQKEQYNVTN
jgi:hypothetical protein